MDTLTHSLTHRHAALYIRITFSDLFKYLLISFRKKSINSFQKIKKMWSVNFCSFETLHTIENRNLTLGFHSSFHLSHSHSLGPAVQLYPALARPGMQQGFQLPGIATHCHTLPEPGCLPRSRSLFPGGAQPPSSNPLVSSLSSSSWLGRF